MIDRTLHRSWMEDWKYRGRRATELIGGPGQVNVEFGSVSAPGSNFHGRWNQPGSNKRVSLDVVVVDSRMEGVQHTKKLFQEVGILHQGSIEVQRNVYVS